MGNISDRIAQVLKEKALTQNEASKKIGISQGTLSQFISGSRNPSDRTIADIARALNINESWLRTGEGEMNADTPAELAAALCKKYGMSPETARLLEMIIYALDGLDDSDIQIITDRIIEYAQRVQQPQPPACVPAFDPRDLRPL